METNKLPSYAVLNMDGTYAGAPCYSYEEARELALNGSHPRYIAELHCWPVGVGLGNHK